MYKISDIISTPVISLYEGDYIGIIYNIMFDYKQKKCNCACILDENDNIPHIIKFKDIYKIGTDCIYIRNKSALCLETNCEKEIEKNLNPLNQKVYDLECNHIGTIHDIIIDEKYSIQQIILNNGKIINKDDIFNIGKSATIIGNSKITINKLRPTQKAIKVQKFNDNKVTILSSPLKESKNKNNKIITDFRFLIGRILNQDVIAINGELIAKKDAVVTKEIVNKASYFGKLVEIARYSKS